MTTDTLRRDRPEHAGGQAKKIERRRILAGTEEEAQRFRSTWGLADVPSLTGPWDLTPYKRFVVIRVGSWRSRFDLAALDEHMKQRNLRAVVVDEQELGQPPAGANAPAHLPGGEKTNE